MQSLRFHRFPSQSHPFGGTSKSAPMSRAVCSFPYPGTHFRTPQIDPKWASHELFPAPPVPQTGPQHPMRRIVRLGCCVSTNMALVSKIRQLKVLVCAPRTGARDPPNRCQGGDRNFASGPGKAWISRGCAEDMVPGPAGRGGRPLRPLSGCPGEGAKFCILTSPPPTNR
jgi:hypothetical protein